MHLVQQQLNAYRELFPEEAPELTAVHAQISEEGLGCTLRSNMRGHLTSSLCVLDPAMESVLLIFHGAYRIWLPPGGHFEAAPGATYVDLRASALREVEEETGVRRIRPILLSHAAGVDIPLDVNTHPIAARPSKNEGPHFHHDFVFLAVAEDKPELVIQESEIGGATWRPLTDFAIDSDARNRRMAKKIQAILANR